MHRGPRWQQNPSVQHTTVGFSLVGARNLTGVCASAQDQERKVSVCWILPARTDHREIAGYCTLAAYSVSPGDLPHEVTGKLPRYPQVPAAILGRSAVSARHQGQGPGQHLQLDAMQRSLDQSRALGLLALFVDAKDEQAANFYRRYDFGVTLPSQPPASLPADEGNRGAVFLGSPGIRPVARRFPPQRDGASD